VYGADRLVGIEIDPVEAARAPGANSLIHAHNSVNFASSLASYLDLVRKPSRSIESVNVFIDDQGPETTLRRGI
jgi:hypothetical protein